MNNILDTKANPKYKDSLFRRIFGENKTNALSLYNAINNSNYTDESELEYTTLDDVIYIKIKNDVSFLVGTSLNLYEHQSSYNPNMPLRGFLYFADLYRQIIKDNERIYSQQIVRIPNPKYIVFYNGSTSKVKDDVIKLKLSDCFEVSDYSGEFEWTATLVNINMDFNQKLFEKCRILQEYSIFIQRVKDYNVKEKDLSKAIDKAVDDCIQDDILRDILEKQKKEGRDVVLTEFDEEKFEEMLREEGREEGRKVGQIEIYCKFVANGRVSFSEAVEECGLSEKEFLDKMKELGLDLPANNN